MPDPAKSIEHRTLDRAIERSGLSTRQFATRIMGRGERTIRYWLEGRPIPADAARWLAAYVDGDVEVRLKPRIWGS